MLSTLSRIVLITALSAFVGTVLVDPADHLLHLKMPLLILTLGLWMGRVIAGISRPGGPQIWAPVLLFAVLLPGAATVIALMGSSLPPGEPQLQMLKQFTVLLLIPVLWSERVNLTRHIIAWSFVTACLTLALAALSLFAPLPFVAIRAFAVESDNAFISSRSLLGLGIGSFYYKTIGVVVFPIAYYSRSLISGSRRTVSLAVILFFVAAVLCSDNRALAVGVLCVIGALLFEQIRARRGMGAALAVLFVITALPAGYIATFFQSTETSNQVKLGHIKSYISEFESHPTYLLWGQGADTQFYSQGFETETTKTELTYLDIIRWFGVPLAAVLLVIFLYPVALLRRGPPGTAYLFIPYLVYLLEAITDPLLICSTGLMIVGSIWAIAFKQSPDNSIVRPAEIMCEPV